MFAVGPLVSDSHEHIILAVTGFVTGGGLFKALNYISHQMPPLPPNSGWWTQFLYSMMKGVSSHDPTSNPTKGVTP